ncbi:MAG: class I SAM-dependent methyltransferase [Flavobacteriales bacterium]|nr:class I SAM-dependent methyltransferase [Flavobacteriales bacterium]
MGNTNYRDRLYGNYYSTHVSGGDAQRELAQFRWKSRRIMSELRPFLPRDKQSKILDLGCGNGALIVALQAEGYAETFGIDLSEEQLEMARKNGAVQVRCADGLEFLRDHKEAFDVICAIDLLEHQTKDEAVQLLDLIRASLRPGGLCLVRVPNVDAPYGTLFAYGDLTHEMVLNKDSAAQLFRACGFQPDVLPSSVRTESFLKELIRQPLWFIARTWMKAVLFASSRTWRDVIFTPNMIVVARKPQ